MAQVLRLDGLLAKLETTYGTDSVPTVGSDAVRVSRRLWSQIQVDYAWENLRSDVASGLIIPVKPALPRGRFVRMDIFWEVKGAGIDAAPEASPLYQACGWTETDGTQLFSYAQASQLHKSCSIYAYASGMVFKIVGCRGRWQWPMVVGEIAIHQFTMFGFLSVEPAPIALPGGFTYDTAEPIAGVASSLTIGSWTPDWLSATFDPIGNDVSRLDSGNATDGIREFDYGAVDPSFRMTARMPRDASGLWDQATYDPYADLKARTTRALTTTWGTAQFNRVKLISGTNLSLRKVSHADSDAFVNFDLLYFVEAATLQFD